MKRFLTVQALSTSSNMNGIKARHIDDILINIDKIQSVGYGRIYFSESDYLNIKNIEEVKEILRAV